MQLVSDLSLIAKHNPTLKVACKDTYLKYKLENRHPKNPFVGMIAIQKCPCMWFPPFFWFEHVKQLFSVETKCDPNGLELGNVIRIFLGQRLPRTIMGMGNIFGQAQEMKKPVGANGSLVEGKKSVVFSTWDDSLSLMIGG